MKAFVRIEQHGIWFYVFSVRRPECHTISIIGRPPSDVYFAVIINGLEELDQSPTVMEINNGA